VTEAPGSPQWCLVTVAGVHLELPGVHPEVVLEETTATRRQLRIPVGFAEGTAIAYAWRQIPTPRPLTHELLAELLDRHGVDVAALRITGRSGSTFLAELDTEGPRGRHTVSCRPSDGLALVLRRRLPTPVLVADDLFPPAPDATGEAVPPGAEVPDSV
jgi:bifunctional DNase/RNase